MNNKIPLSYYKEYFPKFEELSHRSAEKKLSFWHQMVLVASSVNGILISLHTGNLCNTYTRWAYLLSVTLLTLGVLISGVVLRDYSLHLDTVRKAYSDEVSTAIQEDRKIQNVLVDYKKRTLICEKIALALLIAALILMTAYIYLKEMTT